MKTPGRGPGRGRGLRRRHGSRLRSRYRRVTASPGAEALGGGEGVEESGVGGLRTGVSRRRRGLGAEVAGHPEEVFDPDDGVFDVAAADGIVGGVGPGGEGGVRGVGLGGVVGVVGDKVGARGPLLDQSGEGCGDLFVAEGELNGVSFSGEELVLAEVVDGVGAVGTDDAEGEVGGLGTMTAR